MTCSHTSWHTLWGQFNRLTTDRIRVDRGALNDVVSCGGKLAPGLLVREPRADATTVEVYRAALFEFLRAHGAAELPDVRGPTP